MSQDAGATDDSSTKATLTTRGGVRHFNIKRSAANLVEHRKCTSCWIGMHNVPVEMPVKWAFMLRESTGSIPRL